MKKSTPEKKSGKDKKSARRKLSRKRRIALLAGSVVLVLVTIFSSLATWYVHHPRRWIERYRADWPWLVTAPLECCGSAVGDITDGLGLTGHDAVYEYDEQAPKGSVLFAGAPRRTGAPAPNDIHTVNRGEFLIGWSPKLHHPVWCAYHVVPTAKFVSDRRNFQRDKSVPGAPAPSAYERSGYDRGHLAPNHAIVTRYGPEAQKKTFLTSNIAPQTPQLNRGVWRDLEHRIADLWTARYGEIWVIAGCISPASNRETVSGSDIDVPTEYYQVVVAQQGLDVRAFAVVFEQHVPWNAYPARYLVTIDELEERTGLDFLPDLPEFIQSPLEAELPSRVWPVNFLDIFSQIAIRLGY